MRKLIQDKKGQGGAVLGFLLLGIVTVFLLYLISIPMAHVWDETSNVLKDDNAFGTENRTVENVEKFDGFITPLFDQIVFIALIGILGVFFIVAIFTDAHPIFLVFLGIGLVVIVIIASQLVNVSNELVNNEELNSKSSEFIFSGSLMGSLLPIIIFVIGAVAILIIFANRGGVAGG